MRFLPLFLYAKKQTGSDQLNNAIFKLVKVGQAEGRFSSWTSEEIALDKREVTVSNRKIITQAKKVDLQAVDKIKIDGLFYNINDIKGDDYARWRIIIVSRYGSEPIENNV